MQDGELPRVPQRLQRPQARIEPEEAVEVERGPLGCRRLRDRDARARAVVLGVAERYDDAEAVDGAALEDRNQPFCASRRAGGAHRPREERRREPEAHEGERAVLQEYSAGLHHYRTP